MSYPKLQEDPGTAMLEAERSIPWLEGPDENLLMSHKANPEVGGTDPS